MRERPASLHTHIHTHRCTLAGVCMCVRESNTLPFSPRCCFCWSVMCKCNATKAEWNFTSTIHYLRQRNHYIFFNTTNKKQQRKTNTASSSQQPTASSRLTRCYSSWQSGHVCVWIQTKKIKEKLKAFFVLDRMHKYNTTTYVCEMICAFSQSLRVFHYHFLFFFFRLLYTYTLHVTCDREKTGLSKLSG